jgi:hypothetical protein
MCVKYFFPISKSLNRHPTYYTIVSDIDSVTGTKMGYWDTRGEVLLLNFSTKGSLSIHLSIQQSSPHTKLMRKTSKPKMHIWLNFRPSKLVIIVRYNLDLYKSKIRKRRVSSDFNLFEYLIKNGLGSVCFRSAPRLT